MKNLFITGVSTGIGYGAAGEFCRNGYRVIGTVRKKELSCAVFWKIRIHAFAMPWYQDASLTGRYPNFT